MLQSTICRKQVYMMICKTLIYFDIEIYAYLAFVLGIINSVPENPQEFHSIKC